jgi:hypothetical protein
MAMTEAHKQAIREGIERKRLAAEQNRELNPGVTVGKHSFTPHDELVSTPPRENAAGVTEIRVSMQPVGAESAFAVWLKTPEGWSCSDPRVPQDRVRLGVYLEDVLRKAFNAGYREGSV